MSLYDHVSVTIVGRLTRDPELRYAPSGIAVAEFGVASSKSYKKNDEWQEKSRFYDCVIFGERAENLVGNGILAKGVKVFIEGDLDQDTWDDKETGQKRSKLKVIPNKLITFKEGPGRQNS